MNRQKRIANTLIEITQLAMSNPEAEVIISVSKDKEDQVRTIVEATDTTMLTAGLSLAIKSAINQRMPLFILQELLASLYQDVLEGKECVDRDPDV